MQNAPPRYRLLNAEEREQHEEWEVGDEGRSKNLSPAQRSLLEMLREDAR